MRTSKLGVFPFQVPSASRSLRTRSPRSALLQASTTAPSTAPSDNSNVQGMRFQGREADEPAQQTACPDIDALRCQIGCAHVWQKRMASRVLGAHHERSSWRELMQSLCLCRCMSQQSSKPQQCSQPDCKVGRVSICNAGSILLCLLRMQHTW